MSITLDVIPAVTAPDVLPLENGDHLSRAEFDRRWEAMPQIKNAELINGVVHMQAAVRHSWHGKPHSCLVTLVSSYYAATPGTDGGDNASVLIDDENEPQPDVYLMLDANRGGQVVIDDKGYLNGVPEFVAEIAASSSSYDLFEKSDLYQKSGVKEYVVWKVLSHEFVIRRSVNGQFEEFPPTDDGIYRSQVFPGLWLDTKELIQGNLAAALKTLQAGIESAEHQFFLRELEQRLADNRRDGADDSVSTITE